MVSNPFCGRLGRIPSRQRFESVHHIRQGQCRDNPLWLSVGESPRFIRDGTGAVPYNDDDAVDMIRHDLELVHLDTMIEFRQFIPGFYHHFSCRICHHLAINYFTE